MEIKTRKFEEASFSTANGGMGAAIEESSYTTTDGRTYYSYILKPYVCHFGQKMEASFNLFAPTVIDGLIEMLTRVRDYGKEVGWKDPNYMDIKYKPTYQNGVKLPELNITNNEECNDEIVMLDEDDGEELVNDAVPTNQREVLRAVLGDPNWEPSEDQIEYIRDLILKSDIPARIEVIKNSKVISPRPYSDFKNKYKPKGDK